MKIRYCLPLLFALTSLYTFMEVPCIVKTVPSESLCQVIMARHSFYNGPRNSIDNPAWNAFTNHKECAQWDELDYWHAIYDVSKEQTNVDFFESKQYYAYGYIFTILESVRLNITHQWKLYDYSAFWRFLQSCPDYQEIITQVYELIQKDKQSYNQLSSTAYKLICSEYHKIKQQNDEKSRIFKKHQHIRHAEEVLENSTDDVSVVDNL